MARESTELIQFLFGDSCQEDALFMNNREGSPSARVDDGLFDL